MSRPVALALSPHLDDAVFSCGGTLAGLARRGWRVVVATVFTGSVPDPTGFALACQLDKGLGPEVDYMALRRDEDAAACRVLGAEAVHLPFREAPHRRYGSAPALFGPPREDDAIGPPLADAVAALLAEFRPTLLLAPQAIGGHVDHVQLVRALRPGTDAAWWRDFPYVARTADPAEPFGSAMEGKAAVAVALDEGEADRREEACLAYRSQLGFQFGGPERLRAALAAGGRAERFAADAAMAGILTEVFDA